jgi:RimJ/RimL family protein N-acetyltransferase
MSIYLRELTREDIKTINVWRNDKRLVDQLGANFHFVNRETDEQWFDQYLKNRATQIRMAIIEEKTDQFIGVIYLLELNFINRTGLYGGLLIGEKDCQGKGYGTLATLKMLEHAFNDLNLNRIFGYWLEENERSIAVAKKCGFVDEGTMRQCVYKNGIFKNMKIMSILKEEFVNLDKPK